MHPLGCGLNQGQGQDNKLTHNKLSVTSLVHNIELNRKLTNKCAKSKNNEHNKSENSPMETLQGLSYPSLLAHLRHRVRFRVGIKDRDE